MTPDGRRFLLSTQADAAAVTATPLFVLVNWPTLVLERQQVPDR
jgi:hypothetical protein